MLKPVPLAILTIQLNLLLALLLLNVSLIQTTQTLNSLLSELEQLGWKVFI